MITIKQKAPTWKWRTWLVLLLLPVVGSILFISTFRVTAGAIHTGVAHKRTSLTVSQQSQSNLTRTQSSEAIIPDLSISIDVIPRDRILPGQSIVYTLRFTNIGTSLAGGIIVTSILPSEATLFNITVDALAVVTHTSNGPTHTWYISDLAPSSQGLIMLEGRVDSQFTSNQLLTHTAMITGLMDSNLANNVAHAALEVVTPRLYFGTNEYSIIESTNTELINIETSQANPYADILFQYATLDGSASSTVSATLPGLADYISVSGILTVEAGLSVATFDVSVLDDDVAEGHETLVLTIQPVAGAGIGIPPTATLHIVDNDGAGVFVDTTFVEVSESGTTDTYHIRLTSQPTVPVRIEIQPNSQITITPDHLIFNALNWNSPQPITVIAIDDFIAEELSHMDTIHYHVSSTDPHYNNFAIGPLSVDILDNDSVGGLIDTTLIEVSESGITDIYHMRLTSQPTAPVFIEVLPNSQITTTPDHLTFSTLNWGIPQMVTVTAIDDFVAEELPRINTIRHRVKSTDSNYNDLAIDLLIVDIEDNDRADVVVSSNRVRVAENGLTNFFTVNLNSEPMSAVTITVNSGSQTRLNTERLTFDQTNWQIPQSVGIDAIDDAKVEGIHQDVLSFQLVSLDIYYNHIGVENLIVDIMDNDHAAIIVSTSGITVAEGGLTDTYEIVLNSQPADLVTIAISTSSQLTTEPSQISFDAFNWQIPQVLTVKAIDDYIAEDRHFETISHIVTSADPNYHRWSMSNVRGEIQDNDKAALHLPTRGMTITEGKLLQPATAIYTVALTSQPVEVVTLTVATDSQIQVDPSILIFDELNWNMPREIVISAVDDDLEEGLHISSVTHSIETTDLYYSQIVGTLSATQVTINIVDNDVAGIDIFMQESITVIEGSVFTYSVVLLGQPMDSVTIMVETDEQFDVTPSELVFDQENWNEPQVVSVSAIEDRDNEGEHYSAISHLIYSSDTKYAELSVSDRVIMLVDRIQEIYMPTVSSQ